MNELEKKTKEIIEMIDLYIIDNHDVDYRERSKMLDTIIEYCRGPK